MASTSEDGREHNPANLARRDGHDALGRAQDIDRLLVAERQELEQFLRLFQVPGLDLELMVNHKWSTRDVLAHVIAWHESFARNLGLLAAGEPPDPPRGTLRQVNREGVETLSGKTVDQLTRRARRAQRIIEAHIGDESIGLIPYRRPGTSYTRAQHLDVVRGHLNHHFWELIEKQLAADTFE
ncbi:hypothetical protein [Rhodococcus ruber]